MRVRDAGHRMGRVGHRFVIAMAFITVFSAKAGEGSAAAVTKPASQAAKTPNQLAAEAKKAADDAVKATVEKLAQEYAAHQKDSKSPVRAKSDYFAQHPSSSATPEAIVAALRRNLPGDAACDVYVKWQLLSGIAGKVDAKLAPQLLAAYREAPTPGDRPGLDAADKRQLDALIRTAKQSNIPAINAKLQKQVEAFRAASAPILEYRDELYVRLPSSDGVLMAGLEDGVMRAGHGLDADRHAKAVLASCQTWAVTATPGQIRAVAEVLHTMSVKMGGGGKTDAGGFGLNPGRETHASIVGGSGGESRIYAANPFSGKSDVRTAFPPSYYEKLEWDDKAKRLVWKEGQAKFPDAKALAASWQQLEETAAALSQLKR